MYLQLIRELCSVPKRNPLLCLTQIFHWWRFCLTQVPPGTQKNGYHFICIYLLNFLVVPYFFLRCHLQHCIWYCSRILNPRIWSAIIGTMWMNEIIYLSNFIDAVAIVEQCEFSFFFFSLIKKRKEVEGSHPTFPQQSN